MFSNKVKPTGPCPCGSGETYANCCRVFHKGEKEPPTAQALMRSRYSAFAAAQPEYLWKTLHPEHHDRAAGEERAVAMFRQSSAVLRYKGLTILDVREAKPGQFAYVLFHARLFREGHDVSFMELSRFGHDGKGWRYLDGKAKNLRGVPPTLTIDQFEPDIDASDL